MARIHIPRPQNFHFETRLPVRISDINFGGHLAHDAILTLLHEARARLFASHGWEELDVAGAGIVVADAALVYLSEAHYGDTLRIRISVGEFTSKGCELVYEVQDAGDGRDVAMGKTGVVFYDYESRSAITVPEVFRAAFP